MDTKDIDDYVERDLGLVKPDQPLPCNLHLFFAQNRHVLLWKKTSESLTTEFLSRYLARGVTRVWIHQKDVEAFDAQAQATKLEIPAELSTPLEDLLPKPRTIPPTGEAIAALLKSTSIEEKRRAALAAQSARSVLKKAAAGGDLETARIIVIDLLSRLPALHLDLLQEVWDLSDDDPDLVHGVNVASLSVLLTLALGRSEIQTLSEMALAGAFHDLGMTQVHATVASTPYLQLTETQREEQERHVASGVELVGALFPGLPERVGLLIRRHHEKFDGTGYPERPQSFELDALTQVLEFAELIDALCNGQWDGTHRSLAQASQTLQELEKQKELPQFFNPGLLSAILKVFSFEADGGSELIRKAG